MRKFYAAPALACAALLAYGYWLQYFGGQDPCPLCLIQRAFYLLIVIVFAVAAVHGPGRAGGIAYAAAGGVLALGGLGTAGRQVWLQHLPPEHVPPCGPDLYYMIDHFPLARVFEKLFTGSGECAEVKWRFLGLSIAEWSLAWFLALSLYAIWLGIRARRGGG
ncbi:MAG: disulfide bond formation protein B [Proteobacteria bacterium]|nr:disulfide bond formation protein B [Pseudomonadota bacterium]